MKSRDTRPRIMVGGEDYTHQLFGKDPKIFRPTQGQCWSYPQVMSLFRAFEEMPNRSARLHGVELTALTKAQAYRVGVGDLLLQIHGDPHSNKSLRKTIVKVIGIEEKKREDSGAPIFEVEKVWPLSIDWGYEGWTNSEDIHNPSSHLSYRPDIFPTLHFGFEIVNADRYNYVGNSKYDAAAKKAAEFMAMLECHELALRTLVNTPMRNSRFGKVEALKQDLGDAYHTMNQNFRSAYYTLRTLLVDRTMQGFGGLFNEQRRTDRITPLMQAMYNSTVKMISNEEPNLAKDSKIIKALVYPDSASSSVADRLNALLNPAYFPEHDRSDYWKVYNRKGVFCGLAGNLKQASADGKLLQDLFCLNYNFFKAHMPGLNTDGLHYHWKE